MFPPSFLDHQGTSIQGNKIVILEQVHFATDEDMILPESFPILEDVARLLAVHTEIAQVLIEGHTDIRASEAYNRSLSQRRADSVMRFLVARGVQAYRLRAQGFGRSRPIAPNTSEAGMAQNRRVEFTIERTGGSLPRALPGAPAVQRLPRSLLPDAGQLPRSALPEAGQLPRSVLPETGTLPRQVLPPGTHTLPSKPVLPSVDQPAAPPR